MIKLYTLIKIHSVILQREMEDGIVHRHIFSVIRSSVLSSEDINTHVLKVEV